MCSLVDTLGCLELAGASLAADTHVVSAVGRAGAELAAPQLSQAARAAAARDAVCSRCSAVPLCWWLAVTATSISKLCCWDRDCLCSWVDADVQELNTVRGSEAGGGAHPASQARPCWGGGTGDSGGAGDWYHRRGDSGLDTVCPARVCCSVHPLKLPLLETYIFQIPPVWTLLHVFSVFALSLNAKF